MRVQETGVIALQWLMNQMHSDPAQDRLGESFAAVRGAFVAVGGFSLVINLLMLMPALYMLQIYDRVLASRNESTLYLLTLVVVGVFLLDGLLELVRAKVLIRVGVALDLAIGPRVFDASFARHRQGVPGTAGQALSDLATIRQFLTGRGLFAFFDAPWTPIFVGVIFLLHPWLGVFALLAVLLLLGLALAAEWATAGLLTQANQLAHGANRYASSHVRNAEVVEAMGMLSGLRVLWAKRQTQMLVLQAQASHRGAAISATTKVVRMGFQSGVLGLGALLVLDNALTPGGMIAASILLGRALSPVDQAIGGWRSMVLARDARRRLGVLLANFTTDGARTTLPRPKGAVQVNALVLGAPGGRSPILKRIDLAVPAGSLVAVIGPSASGKSTLARALVGVWPPISGAVRLDGAEVHQWDKDELGPWIGYLPQDVELLEGSVADNIARFGVADSGLVVSAAQRAGVHETILRLPQGYQTEVGETGAALSGGQRQRIALARAMYGDPALLVLDEPNSSLDQDGDDALAEALRALKREQRTVFVVTHRPNLLGLADLVLVLADGQVHAFGPRDTVLQALKNPAKGIAEHPSSRLVATPGQAA